MQVMCAVRRRSLPGDTRGPDVTTGQLKDSPFLNAPELLS